MDVLDAIKLRRSIRKYKDIRVEWEKLVLLAEAGKSAPTAGNLQNFKFVIVTDKNIIKDLSEACLKQYWMQTAPAIVAIVGEHEKAAKFYGVRGERLYTIQNCAAAAENILITATSLGLGSCWVGAFDENMVKEVLNIPDRARPQAIITVGYADEVVPEPMHYPLETQAHLETYGNRFLDMAAVNKDFSVIIERNVSLIKRDIRTTAQKVKDRIKEHMHNIKENIKKKKQEKEYKAQDIPDLEDIEQGSF